MNVWCPVVPVTLLIAGSPTREVVTSAVLAEAKISAQTGVNVEAVSGLMCDRRYWFTRFWAGAAFDQALAADAADRACSASCSVNASTSAYDPSVAPEPGVDDALAEGAAVDSWGLEMRAVVPAVAVRTMTSTSARTTAMMKPTMRASFFLLITMGS